MTTSSPNVTPPAGGGDPDPDGPKRTPDEAPDPLLADRLEGAVPTPDDPETPEADTASGGEGRAAGTDSVEDDKRRTGAE